MSLNLSFGGHDMVGRAALDALLATRGLGPVAQPDVPLQAWSVKQAAPRILDALAASERYLPQLDAPSLSWTAIVPLPVAPPLADDELVVLGSEALQRDVDALIREVEVDGEAHEALVLLRHAIASARRAGCVLWLF